MHEIMKCSTISEIIKYGQNLELSHEKLHLKASFNKTNKTKLIFNFTSLLDKYYEYLKKYFVEVTFTEDEYLKYRFQPKTLSMDLYETPELWSTILRINNIVSISEFDKRKIIVLKENVFDLLNEILIMEDDAMKNNKEECYK